VEAQLLVAFCIDNMCRVYGLPAVVFDDLCVELTGTLKMRDWNLWHRHGQKCRGGKCETGKWSTKSSGLKNSGKTNSMCG